MRSFEIPYHPDADQGSDSLLRVHVCITRLERLRDIIADWLRAYGETDREGQSVGLAQCPPVCLKAIQGRIEVTLRSIEKGRRRPSGKFVKTVDWIDGQLSHYQNDLDMSNSDAYSSYGSQLRDALSDADALRDRLASQ